MKKLISILTTSLLLAGCISAEQAEEGWTPLFNGKNLEGWTPKIRGYEAGDNVGNTFRVEDGLLKVSYDQYDKFDGKFGHLFYKEPLSDYRLRVEYRFVGEQLAGGPGWAKRNSGIMIHSQTPQSMGKNQDFPHSIEVQTLGGDGSNPRSTGNLCTPGTHVEINGKLVKQHVVNSTSKTFHGEQWVTVEVEARGSHIKHFVNGELVLEYDKAQLDDPKKKAEGMMLKGEVELIGGTISLQSESHPVEFRKVEMKKLKAKD